MLDSVNWLVEHEGAEVTWLPTASDGSVSAAALRAVLQSHDDVALVSVMWANNEVGTVMPIAELAAVAAEFDVPMHSDAVQAVGQLPVDFAASGLSAMSVAAHKFGGPHGGGRLAAAPRRQLRAAVARWRPGTRHPFRHCRCRRARSEWRRRFGSRWTAWRPTAPGCARCGIAWSMGCWPRSTTWSSMAPASARLPGNAHFTFRGCEGDALLMLLDANGIECSTGSACTAGVPQASHVLLAMGADAGHRPRIAAVVVGAHQC